MCEGVCGGGWVCVRVCVGGEGVCEGVWGGGGCVCEGVCVWGGGRVRLATQII